MTTFKGATFEIISGNGTCPVYDDPEAHENEDPWTQQRYIEAITGAKFKIKVTLKDSFAFNSSDAVRVRFTLDSANHSYSQDIKRQDFKSNQIRSARLDRMRTYCPQTNRWLQGCLVLGGLKIEETSNSTISTDELKSLGRIRVSYQRIMYGQERDIDPLKSAFHYTQRVSEVSEKTLKGKSVENTIDWTDLVRSKSPNRRYTEGHRLPGSLGEKVTVDFLYRSKRTLQMIGCIPRSPSPSPVPVTMSPAAPNAATNTSVLEEVRILRARLAELERQCDTKPSVAGIKAETSSMRTVVKRERDNLENETIRKRGRLSGPIETVDLTDD